MIVRVLAERDGDFVSVDDEERALSEVETRSAPSKADLESFPDGVVLQALLPYCSDTSEKRWEQVVRMCEDDREEADMVGVYPVKSVPVHFLEWEGFDWRKWSKADRLDGGWGGTALKVGDSALFRGGSEEGTCRVKVLGVEGCKTTGEISKANDDGVLPCELLCEPELRVVVAMTDKWDDVPLSGVRLFEKKRYDADLLERHRLGIEGSQIHRYPCGGTCHKNQMMKPKEKRKCRLGYLLVLVDRIIRRKAAGAENLTEHEHEELRRVLLQIVDSPHVVPHSMFASCGWAINQCWKLVASGAGARASTIYKTKYITK